MEKREFLLIEKLFLLLKKEYPEYANNPTRSKKSFTGQAYYRNQDKQYQDFRTRKYTLENIHKYLFLTLFSQNTSDVVTFKVSRTINEAVSDKTVKDWVKFLEPYFYKHKHKYSLTLKALATIVLESLTQNKRINFKELIAVPMVGYKTAAIIYNHFFQDLAYPVIDVNVHKAYNIFMPEYKKKDANKLFETLMKYQEMEKVQENTDAAILANLLWIHRKSCKAQNCKYSRIKSSSSETLKKEQFCKSCSNIKSELENFAKAPHELVN